jgi:mRNA interferase RelE/StbE
MHVLITPSAKRQLESLPEKIRIRIDKRILSLGVNPRPHGSVTLEGVAGLHRIRVGDYRIIYRIQDKEMTVLIVRIGHRREVYRPQS